MRIQLRIFLPFVFCVGLCALHPRPLAADVMRRRFDNAMAALQASPDNLTLREKVIRLYAQLPSPPPVPDEVLELKGKAAAAMTDATKASDYKAGVDAYRQATLLAPWVGDLYYNKGILESKAEMPAQAIDDFKLYLLATPNAPDKDKVLLRIGREQLALDKQKKADDQAAAARTSAATQAAAMAVWQQKNTTTTVIIVIGVIGMTGAIVDLALGFGNESSAAYTVAPGYSNGVLYNIAYEGKFWSNDSYSQYTSGESDVHTGAIVAGVSVAVTLLGILVSPGPAPSSASLLNFDSGKLAFGLPSVSLDRSGTMQGTLVHAVF